MYKFFINDRPLVICSKEEVSGWLVDLPKVENPTESQLMDLVRQTEEPTCNGLVIAADDPASLFHSLKSHFTTIHAGGGIVFNHHEELLLMKRMGKWDLPKGKTDPGETMEEAALREVQEECGIPNLSAERFFRDTFHTYKIQGHRFLKVTHWFLMITDYPGPLTPQTEEHISEVIWFSYADLDVEKLDTYESIRDLLRDLKAERP